ncbi:MAG TPA: hypothetical protein VF192_09365 [Longimicrobiales bacterium]
MRILMQKPPAHLRLLALAAAIGLAAPADLAAQAFRQPPAGVPTPCEEWENPRVPPPARLCDADFLARSPFNLRGQGDIAYTGLRAASQNIAFWVGNYGMGPWQRTDYPPIQKRGVEAGPSTWVWEVFDLQPYIAAAPSEWRRHRETVASLQNVIGGGYMWETNLYPDIEHFTAHDGSFGVLHSGAQSTNDDTCKNHTASFIQAGFPLMAGSDCPETWGSAGWQGARPISQEGWEEFFRQRGSQFTFDWWLVPEELHDPNRQFIGTAFQTFGMMSDHGREIRAMYGSVVPGGTGDPQLEGYPLGIDIAFDAFTFNVPTVAGMFILQGVLINNTEEVYGVGLDYDSLYFGFQTRWLRAPPGSGRRAAVHAIVERGAVVSNELGRTPDCDGLEIPPDVDWINCPALRARVGRGFRVGATGIMWLKSPIGDLRNKHFSDPNSPFYDPSHPLAGDTITFNRMSLCGFECGQIQFLGPDRRGGYGVIAANTADALNGRDPAAMTGYDTWMLIKPYNGSGPGAERCDIANDPRGPGCFNWYVPDPNWTYTNRPEGAPATGPDTLFFDTCNPVLNACVALWSDTLPDGTGNYSYNNTWSGAGPFPLKAGDSVGFTVAFLAAVDSAQFAALLENTYQFYRDFYLGPDVPAPVTIRATAQGGIRDLGQPRVRIFLDDAASQWVDEYTARLADKIEQGTTGDTRLERLYALNPWLVDSIRAYNHGNVSRILVYKSCDGGATFTADDTPQSGRCRAAPLEDDLGNTVSPGWQAYDQIVRNSSGDFPTVYEDPYVLPGQSYLYAFVAESPGIRFTVWDSVDVDEDGVFDGVDRTVYEVTPPTRNTLATNPSLPNVESVYVPISSQAGGRGARIALDGLSGGLWTSPGFVGTPFVVDGATAGLANVVVDVVEELDAEVSYRLVFVDSVVVTAYGPAEARDSTIVSAYRSALVGFGPGGAPVYKDYSAAAPLRWKSTQPTGILVTGPDTALVRTSTADSEETRVRARAGILVTGAGEPLYVSANLSSSFTPNAIFGRPEFPGLIVSVRDSLGRQYPTEYRNAQDEVIPNSDAWPFQRFLGGTATGASYGRYLIRWSDDPYGSTAPFRINAMDRDATRAVVEDAIARRADAATSATGQAVADALSAALGRTVSPDELAAVGLPFTITNASYGNRPVTVAVLAADLPEAIRIGSGADTAWIRVPEGKWMPGTPVYLLEEVPVAQTDAAGEVVLQDGQPVYAPQLAVTWAPARIGCSGDLPSCNPVVGPGTSGGYNRMRPDYTLVARFGIPLRSGVELAFTVSPSVRGEAIASLGRHSLDDVLVVPNPYVVASAYEVAGDGARLAFTNLPPSGEITIYTAAGQFVQRITWTPQDLTGDGDLFWNMRTHEETDLAAGFYMFVVTARDPETGATRRKLGKFIVIR